MSNEFDIFFHRPIQTAVLGTVETVYKSLAPVEQNDLEFLIPGGTDTYIDLDIELYVRSKMVSSSGKDVYLKDTTAVNNNLLHSLFSECTVMLNCVAVTQLHEHYNYRAYLETPDLWYRYCLTTPLYLLLVTTRATCSRAIPRPKRTLPPQTTDS